MTRLEKNIPIWIDALRSGKYKQGFGALNPHPDLYCCLGVACKIFIPENKQWKFGNGGMLSDCLVGAAPYSQLHAPKWLQEFGYTFTQLAHVEIVTLNDYVKYTFDEIADILQAIYIEKVLD